MRPLYPCAHHDRFIHSLGTYHLGQMVCHYMRMNSGEYLRTTLKECGINFDELFENLKKTFEIACLLHDVGHTPFSHTFEDYFLLKKVESGEPVIDAILSGKNSVDGGISIMHATNMNNEFTLFCSDYKKINTTAAPKPHEKTSAILVLSEYFDAILRFKVDPYLVARMIMGMAYRDELHDDNKAKLEKQVYNLFIRLLNGKTIDVDKLDYLARDQWACGRGVAKNVDYERLLSSLYIFPDPKRENKLDICYHKRAISEILALVQAKKAITSTIHHHHLIKYDAYVLKKAIEEVASILGKSPDKIMGKDDIMGKIISLQAIKEDAVKIKEYTFRLLTDDDLIHIMKVHLTESEHAQEWFYRKYRLRPVWKTSADYNYFFGDNEQTPIYSKIKDIIISFLEVNGIVSPKEDEDFHLEEKLDDEYNQIAIPDINILIKDEVVKLDTIASVPPLKVRNAFFLLYVPKKILQEKRSELIEYIRREAGKYSTAAKESS